MANATPVFSYRNQYGYWILVQCAFRENRGSRHVVHNRDRNYIQSSNSRFSVWESMARDAVIYGIDCDEDSICRSAAESR